jgi:hypothetical protein
MNMNKGSATEDEILRFLFASLRASCMDYHHHHLVSHHRTMMVEAPVNGLEAVDTMEVNSVMMSVIHTLRLTQDDREPRMTMLERSPSP